jgi:hypothetical protein
VFQHTKKGFRVRIIYLRISPDKMRKNKTANVKLRIKKHFFANMLTKHLKTAQIVIVWTSSSFSLLIRTFCDLPKLSLRFHFHKKKKKNMNNHYNNFARDPFRAVIKFDTIRV